jgi:hypothetical protein
VLDKVRATAPRAWKLILKGIGTSLVEDVYGHMQTQQTFKATVMNVCAVVLRIRRWVFPAAHNIATRVKIK